MNAFSDGAAGRPVLDVERMRGQLGDDDELVADIIRLYLDDAPIRLHAIAAAIDARDVARLRAEAHTVKGSAGALSAQRVVDAARALEMVAESGDLGLAAPRYAALVSEAERLAAVLREFQTEKS